MAEIGKDLDKAAYILRRGGLVAIPTETVYGLAANALSPEAVLRIFEAKERPSFDPLIVHMASIGQISRYATSFPEMARKLAEALWPGPLTLVLPKNKSIPDITSSGLPTVGLRIPSLELTQRLLGMLDFPLAAPSANPFGYVSPTCAAHVQAQLGDKVDYILDGGPCAVGLESTIVGFDDEGARVLRLGGISLEQIERLIGSVSVNTQSTSNPAAPGMLLSHYAPRKPLYTGHIPDLLQNMAGLKVAVLGFRGTYGQQGEVLSPSGNVAEAAQNLFAALRRLEVLEVEAILAEWAPDEGLGRAINDRLRRASYRH